MYGGECLRLGTEQAVGLTGEEGSLIAAFFTVRLYHMQTHREVNRMAHEDQVPTMYCDEVSMLFKSSGTNDAHRPYQDFHLTGSCVSLVPVPL